MLKAWDVQKHYQSNNFKDDPVLMGIFMCCILLHGHDTTLQDQLAKIEYNMEKMTNQGHQGITNIKGLQRNRKQLQVTIKAYKDQYQLRP